jgi:predicted acylesterase/phospholipase RssA
MATTDRPSSARKCGIALSLSGGESLAALFHLGALRRLSELDVLSSVTLYLLGFRR